MLNQPIEPVAAATATTAAVSSPVVETIAQETVSTANTAVEQVNTTNSAITPHALDGAQLSPQAQEEIIAQQEAVNKKVQEMIVKMQELMNSGKTEEASAVAQELANYVESNGIDVEDYSGYTSDKNTLDATDYAYSDIPDYNPVSSGGSGSAGTIDGAVLPNSGKIVSPLDKFRVTSNFGARNDPITGKASFHNGIDLAAAKGTAVKSVADGTVTRVSNDPDGYGNWVEVKHADGSTSRYAHLSAFGNIKVGQEIGAGTVIGAVGSTGHSTGPHLHFEYRDAKGKAIDPRKILDL